MVVCESKGSAFEENGRSETNLPDRIWLVPGSRVWTFKIVNVCGLHCSPHRADEVMAFLGRLSNSGGGKGNCRC